MGGEHIFGEEKSEHEIRKSDNAVNEFNNKSNTKFNQLLKSPKTQGRPGYEQLTKLVNDEDSWYKWYNVFTNNDDATNMSYALRDEINNYMNDHDLKEREKDSSFKPGELGYNTKFKNLREVRSQVNKMYDNFIKDAGVNRNSEPGTSVANEMYLPYMLSDDEPDMNRMMDFTAYLYANEPDYESFITSYNTFRYY